MLAAVVLFTVQSVNAIPKGLRDGPLFQPHPIDENTASDLFTSFISQHGKKYSHDQITGRLSTFKQNLEVIRKHNVDHSDSVGWFMGVNQFSDLSSQEFQDKYMGKMMPVGPGIKNIEEHVQNVEEHVQDAKEPTGDQGQMASAPAPPAKQGTFWDYPWWWPWAPPTQAPVTTTKAPATTTTVKPTTPITTLKPTTAAPATTTTTTKPATTAAPAATTVPATTGPSCVNPSTSTVNLDWRECGAVTPIKNQGQCGSCWSFAATGALEGRWKLKHNQLISLSEQQLADCAPASSPWPTTNGCGGNNALYAWHYIYKFGGVCTENSYAFTSGSTATAGTCRAGTLSTMSCTQSGVKVSADYGYQIPQNEATIASALNSGPIVFSVQADSALFQHYAGGVLADTATSKCGTSPNHQVTGVGYGTDATTGSQYFLIKNQWGTSWGEAGYMRIKRGINQCGLATGAMYPYVA